MVISVFNIYYYRTLMLFRVLKTDWYSNFLQDHDLRSLSPCSFMYVSYWLQTSRGFCNSQGYCYNSLLCTVLDGSDFIQFSDEVWQVTVGYGSGVGDIITSEGNSPMCS